MALGCFRANMGLSPIVFCNEPVLGGKYDGLPVTIEREEAANYSVQLWESLKVMLLYFYSEGRLSILKVVSQEILTKISSSLSRNLDKKLFITNHS
jgi:hypothetical protein